MKKEDKKEKKPILESYGKVNEKMLKEITEADGVPGQEKEVSRVLKRYTEKICDEVSYDNLGSIILRKKAKGPKLMISGHMDEIGFIVSKIEDSGFIKMTQVGGWMPTVLLAQELRVTTSDGKKLYGIVGCPAPHGKSIEERNKITPISEMFLDLGVSGKKEVEDLGVKLGDMITPTTNFSVMNNPNFLCAKAWDDRVGVALLIDLLENVKSTKLDCDLYCVGSTQEEVGLRGAKTAGYAVRPDIAIAVDVTLNNDYPNSIYGEPLASGVVCSVLDGSHIDSRELVVIVEEICKDLKIDCVRSILPVGGTDVGEIHKSFEGVFSLTLSIPSRSIHSHRSIIHRKDYLDTLKLLTEFVSKLDDKMLNRIKESLR